ncbi:hypothetical protein TW65_04308 [Stemphylium lycopersici]|uniref:Uncharacterized protein n=1 Tax=Stemphylium lycopersici TaxID=183478 RepID=A0A364N048_STELY|nr:hypothetical protein TW65_04308 [Stemphylium lycopersici]RAR08237.1 hypothetical protein DDE83_006078 [Stemphylium lycopersici]
MPTEGEIDADINKRHDSGVTAKSSEMFELENQLESMKLTESKLRRQCNELAQDLKYTRDKAENDIQEALRGLGELSKTRRDIRKLQDELKALKDSEKQAVQDVKMQLDGEKKKWLKIEKSHKTEIEGLKRLVEEKKAETGELKKKITDLSRNLSAARAQAKATNNNTCPSPIQQKQSDGARPNRLAVSSIGNPLDRISELESEIARLKGIHEPHNCEQFSVASLEQLADAKALQEAAEAEVEGYRHFEHANKKLMEKHAADSQQIINLIKEMGRYKVRVKQLEDLAVKEDQADSDVVGSDDAKATVAATLELSAIVPCASVAPVTPQDNDAEIDDLKHRLHNAELEKEMFLTEYADYARSHEDMTAELNANFHEIQDLDAENVELIAKNEQLSSQLEINVQTLNAKFQDTEQQIAKAKEELTKEFQEKLDLLAEQEKQRTNALSTNQNLRAHLDDLGTSILSLSTPSAPKSSFLIRSTSPSIATNALDIPTAISDLLPNIALTIKIRPSEKRNWALLRHVQSAISTSSSLDILGPPDLVRNFVAGMQDVEKTFKEKTELAEKLEMAVVEAQDEIEMLKERVREVVICKNPRHRALKEELEAKESRLQMQSQLLAEWGEKEG